MGKNKKNEKQTIKKTQRLEDTKRISKGFYKPEIDDPK